MWMEQKAEGSRNQRIKLDQARWSTEKILRKIAKHAMWIGFAFLTGFTFVGYFTPITDLSFDFFTGSAELTAYAWIGLFAFMTYLNAGWLREQVCLYMCPYARFQAAMFDSDTLTVTYDNVRGEPRGARRVNEDEKPKHLGDCIDCMLCVQVCPVGIDIRDGLQYECINCALCVDACNSVMEKVGYAPNLIAYSSESRVEGKKMHWLRLRTVGYGGVLLIMCVLFVGALVMRETTDVKILRERNALYQLRDGNIENVYTVKIGNRDRNSQRYTIGIDEKNIVVTGETSVLVESGEEISIPIRLSLPKNLWKRHSFDVKFSACLADTAKASHCIQQKSRFTGPMQ
jgi:cytochrome c oxidase accessory protein FixG